MVHAWHLPYTDGSPFVAMPVDTEALERDASSLLDDIVAAARATDLAGSLNKVLACGSPASCLIDAARDADLLVVGTRGRGGFTGLLLGSVSQQLAHHSPCPLVIVPPRDAARAGLSD